ncbi:MAG: OmpH family outer membrane protein [Firmicutes bacterium]|nr:OmpH family outer membrane protein [Bacillota bacterium]
MSFPKNLRPLGVLVLFILFAGLTFVVRSAGKVPETLTPESIGYIDLDQIHARFPDFVRLQEIKAAYEKELNTFANYQRQSMSTYLQELEKKEEEESAGKSEDEKKEIKLKYEKMAQEKAGEIQQLVQQKNRELQSKLDQELLKAEGKLRQTIEAVAAEKGLNLVLVKSAVYYGGVDLTEAVIDKATGKGKK